MSELISNNLTLEQVTFSSTAIRYSIKNTPSAENLVFIKDLAESIWEPLYKRFNGKLKVTSCYRCNKLNKLIKGSPYSQHKALKGAAIDLVSTDLNCSNKEIFTWVLDNLEFDQLIWEFGNKNNPAWVHISYNKNNNRNQVIYY